MNFSLKAPESYIPSMFFRFVHCFSKWTFHLFWTFHSVHYNMPLPYSSSAMPICWLEKMNLFRPWQYGHESSPTFRSAIEYLYSPLHLGHLHNASIFVVSITLLVALVLSGDHSAANSGLPVLTVYNSALQGTLMQISESVLRCEGTPRHLHSFLQ